MDLNPYMLAGYASAQYRVWPYFYG